MNTNTSLKTIVPPKVLRDSIATSEAFPHCSFINAKIIVPVSHCIICVYYIQRDIANM